MEIDITGEIAPALFDSTYQYHRALIKSGRRLLGWVSFKNEDTVSTETILNTVYKTLDKNIVNHTISTVLSNNKSTSEKGISIVVCTRNRAKQLAVCINSLLALDYNQYEIIIVDNAPDNDETFALVSAMPVRYVREDRPGLDWARNRGIAEASYEIIAFTDDDVRVDKHWLKAIADVFDNEEVMGASGFVAAAELETLAQKTFELQYGGMGHGFFRKALKKGLVPAKQLLWVSNVCIGANMAFRKEAFTKAGNFDTALDVGTPSNGGGDIEMCYRLVVNDLLFVYEPCMLVWHYHRREMPALKKQVFNNGRSFGCFLIDCYQKHRINKRTILKFFFVEWLFKWNIKNWIHPKSKVPKSLSFQEIKGVLTSPAAYRKTREWDKKLRSKFR